ncbi:hypothetical protein DXG01_000192 [Tephrocybe rancida]|nr:hypothetical protein DXG01_000192 [Tephrocybe rancida]
MRISGGPEGAYSVALSGGYEDDVDLGYAFTYTGSGGRDLKGTKTAPKNLRTAPQSSNQTFENPFNRALKRSCETGKPIRVVRGFKLRSKYAPIEGYRYDGLYKVEKAWIEEGLNPGKFLVCKFAFKVIVAFRAQQSHRSHPFLKRLPGQPALAVRPGAGEGSAQANAEEAPEGELQAPAEDKESESEGPVNDENEPSSSVA